MKKIIKSIMLVAAVVAGMGAMTSCSDDDDSNPSRLFRPVVSEDDIVTGVDENKIIYLKNGDIISSEYFKRIWEE